MQRLIERVGAEAPRLSSPVLSALARMLPLGSIPPVTLDCLDAFFASWRRNLQAIDFDSLTWLHEVSLRIALPGPVGFAHLDSAIGIEVKLGEEAPFALERFLVERRMDGTMDPLWIRTLLSMGPRNSHVIAALRQVVDGLPHDDALALLPFVDEVAGGTRAVREWLLALADHGASVPGR